MTKLLEYLIEKLSQTTLFEMAIDRSKYIDKLMDRTDQIIENWCLVHYCTLYDQTNQNKNRWKQELLAQCEYIFDLIVRVDKKKVTRDVMIEYEELTDTDRIKRKIKKKFQIEGFEIKDDLVRDFATYGVYKLAELVSAKCNNTSYQELCRYIDEDI